MMRDGLPLQHRVLCFCVNHSITGLVDMSQKITAVDDKMNDVSTWSQLIGTLE